MGKTFFDKFSYLHFGVGLIVYYWGLSLVNWIIIHFLFEIIENTKYGIFFIDKYFTLWPGGKKFPDSYINIFSDNIFAIIGWVSSYIICNI